MSNPFKQEIAGEGMIRSAWVELGLPDIAEILVQHGWKHIVIDGEHGRGGLEDWVNIARAIESAGGTPIVRLPDGNDTMIKRAVDRGLRNFIVPLVNTAEEARRIVSSFYYPLRGHRGYAAPIIRGSDWGTRQDYARGSSNQDLVIMVQCEHVESVDNLEEIAAVDGIDVIFIGPNDLAASAGHLEQLDAPKVLQLFERIEETVTRHGKLLATIRSPGRDWDELEKRNFKMVVGINDVSLLIDGAHRELSLATSKPVENVSSY